jgi:hypothetical protein
MTAVVTHRRTTWAEVVTVSLAGANAVAALGGAWGLASGVIDFGPAVTSRLPFDSPVFAALCLGAFVGLPNLALALLALARHPLAALGSVVVGAGMVVWIVVQIAVIREFSFFQPLYTWVGLMMAVVGLRQLRQQ